MYHGLILAGRKPMSYGLELLLNYTLSRATDNGQAGVGIGGITFLSTDGIIDPYNLNGEQGFSATDARSRFTGSAVWQPGWGKGANGASNLLLSGWNFSTTVTATNGVRYSGTVQSTATQSVGTTSGLQGGMTGGLIQTTGNPIGGRITWMPRNSFVLPNLFNVDVRLAKQFRITERYNVELRGEAFNILNRTQVLAVSTNAFNYAAPATTSPTCPSATHANTCMVPVATFQQPSTTSANLMGARQLQAGVRFNF
jgi:hypothetical protein